MTNDPSPAVAPQPITVPMLMETIGQFFILWAKVEQLLEAELKLLEPGKELPQSVGLRIKHLISLHEPIAETRPLHDEALQRIKSQLTAAVAVRNRLAHGITGYNADPTGTTGSAYYETLLNDPKEKLTHATVVHTMLQLGRMWASVGRLTSSALEKDPSRADLLCQRILEEHPL